MDESHPQNSYFEEVNPTEQRKKIKMFIRYLAAASVALAVAD